MNLKMVQSSGSILRKNAAHMQIIEKLSPRQSSSLAESCCKSIGN